ncbi:MAG: ABC transporter substrate-binding protein [Acidimicrobiales bacterium]
MRTRFVAAFVALCVGLAACGGDDDSESSDTTSGEGKGQEEPAVDPEGVVHLGYDLASASRGGFTLDPAAAPSTTADLGLFHWIYGGLMRLTPEGTLEPDLAESAELVDTTTIEVVLRDGVTLPDGSPLDAEVVKAALEKNLAKTPETGNKAFRPGFFTLKTVEVSAPDTVVLTIPDGTAASWYDLYLGGAETLIVPEGTDFSAPSGAGPFSVTEYTPSQSMTLEKNSDYWDAGNIQVAGIELVNAPDGQTGITALGAGQVDWARIEFSQIDAVGSDLTVESTPDASRLYQFYTCKSAEPVDDVQVRQALNTAIDREAINQAIFKGTGVVAWDLWPEGHRFHRDASTEHYAYDPEAAKDLLAEAGYEDGVSIDVIPIQGANVPEVVQIVQQQWADIGVTLNIVSSANFVQDFFTDKKAQLGASPITSERGRIDGFTGTALINTCSYNDPELNEIAAQLATVSNTSDEAVEYWDAFQEKIVEEALTIPIVFGAIVNAYDEGHLGDYALVPYTLPVPDLWSMYVKAE